MLCITPVAKISKEGELQMGSLDVDFRPPDVVFTPHLLIIMVEGRASQLQHV